MSSVRDITRKGSLPLKHEALKRSRRITGSNPARATCRPSNVSRRAKHQPPCVCSLSECPGQDFTPSIASQPAGYSAPPSTPQHELHMNGGSGGLQAGSFKPHMMPHTGDQLNMASAPFSGTTPVSTLGYMAEIGYYVEQLNSCEMCASHEVSCPSGDSDLDDPPSPMARLISTPHHSTHEPAEPHTPSLSHPHADASAPRPLLSLSSSTTAPLPLPAAAAHASQHVGLNPSAPSAHRADKHEAGRSRPDSHRAALNTAQGIQMLLTSSRTSLSVAMGVILLGAVMGMLIPGWRHPQEAGAFWGGTGSQQAFGGAQQLLGWNGPRAGDQRSVQVGSGNGAEKPEASRVVNLIAVVPAGEPSPYKATWDEVMLHIAQRLEWNNPDFQLQVFMEGTLKQQGSEEYKRFAQAAKKAEIFVGVQVTDPAAVKAVQSAVSSIPTHVFFDSSPTLESSAMLDGYAPQLQLGPIRTLLEAFPWTKAAQAKNVKDILQVLYKRHTSDDLLFVFLVLINEYITKVPDVANTAKGMDFEGLQCIGRHCSQQVVNCLNDANCKTALDCLQACSFNDQVCQYRCIVSYESKPFEKFALCILQLHNCRNLKAEMPMRPDPAPMTSFRGSPITHQIAEDMFIGWIGEKPYSWLVAGGKNPAYDYFPCQHQLYYRGRGEGVLWYEPVFKAITLDGREVWRRRKYRVRRGKVPGTFHYTVLDNGVTSNEFWRILDCAEDYSFCLFYYSGAASAAGLSYSGAVLATPDGNWPEQHTARIQSALEPAGIKMWELSRVDNSRCQGAPLQTAAPAAPALAA